MIAIEGMHFYAHHGFYKEEQVIGGNYQVDVYLQTDFAEAATNDALDKTINYENVYRIARQVMTEKSKLIEHVAYRVLTQIFEEFASVHQVKVRVSKINPPVKGTVDRVFVELEETR